MNKIYKVIWSKVRNCYVAVSEIAKRNGKSCTSVNCGGKANRSRGLRMAAVTLGVTAALVGGVGFGTPAAWADGTITVGDASQPQNYTTTTGGTLYYSSGFYCPSDPSINQLKITGGVNNSYGFAARYTYGSGESVTGYTVDVSGAGTSINFAFGIRITDDSSGERAASGNRVYITDGASVSGNVYGADGIGVVSGNMVTIDKAYAYRVVGGESGVAAKGNIVNISGIKEGMAYTVSDYVRGGNSMSGMAGGTGENEGNKVNISNGAIVGIYDAVIGGNGGGGAIGNEVTINKSLVENYVLGGYASSGSASKNTVDISGKMDGKNYTVTGSVYGGITFNGTASGNIVKITDAVVNKNSDYSVYGGSSRSNVANSNNVTVSGNSKTCTVYGGYSDTGAAKGNTVTINKNEKGETPQIEGYIYGGYSEKGTAGGATAEEGNKVTISGGTVGTNVYGGRSNSGVASGNIVTITGGTVSGAVYGGYGNTANGNTVTISGGVVKDKIVGGAPVSGVANNNTVNLKGATDLSSAFLAGTSNATDYSGDELHVGGVKGDTTNSNNTNNIWTSSTNNKVEGVRNFETIALHSVAWNTDVAVLEANSVDNIGKLDITGMTIYGSSNAGEKMSLLSSGYDIRSIKLKYNDGEAVSLVNSPVTIGGGAYTDKVIVTDLLKFSGTSADTVSLATDNKAIVYTAGESSVSSATFSGTADWSTSAALYSNTSYTFDTNATANLAGLQFNKTAAVTEDPTGQTMTLISGNVKGTVSVQPTDASIVVSLAKSNTTLGGTATGAAAIAAGNLTYTINNVALESVAVTAAGDMPDALPTGWTKGSAVTVNTGATALDRATGATILSSDTAGLFTGATFSGVNDYNDATKNKHAFASDTAKGVTLDGTQQKGIKASDDGKSLVYAVNDTKDVATITLGTVKTDDPRDMSGTDFDFANTTKVDASALNLDVVEPLNISSPVIPLVTNAKGLDTGVSVDYGEGKTGHSQDMPLTHADTGIVLNATVNGTVATVAGTVNYTVTGGTLNSIALGNWNGTAAGTLPAVITGTGVAVTTGNFTEPTLAAGQSIDIITTTTNNFFGSVTGDKEYKKGEAFDDTKNGVTLSGNKYGGVKTNDTKTTLTYYAESMKVDQVAFGEMAWGTGRAAAAGYDFINVTSVDASGLTFTNPEEATGSMDLLTNATNLAANAAVDYGTGKSAHSQEFDKTLDNKAVVTATLTGTVDTATAGKVSYTSTGIIMSKFDLANWDGATASAVPTGWTLSSGATVETAGMTTPVLDPGKHIDILQSDTDNFFANVTIGGGNEYKAADFTEKDGGITFAGSQSKGVTLNTEKKHVIYAVGTKDVSTATLSGEIKWDTTKAYYTNKQYTFSDSSKVEFAGDAAFTSTTDPLNQSMTLIEPDRAEHAVKGTVSGSPGFTVKLNNTTLEATATGTAAIDSGNLKYTVNSVTLNQVDVAAVGSDAVPAGWTTATNVAVDTENMTVPTEVAYGTPQNILTADSAIFTDDNITGKNKYGATPAVFSDTDSAGTPAVTIAGQRDQGVKASADGKSLVYEAGAKEASSVTLGSVKWASGTEVMDGSSVEYDYKSVTSLGTDGFAMAFDAPETMDAGKGESMTLLKANATLADMSEQVKKTAYSYNPVSGVTVDAAITGKLTTSGGAVTYTPMANQASKLTFTSVDWKDSGALMTRPSNITFAGADVDTTKIHFKNITELDANKKMTLVSDFGDSVGTITGTKYTVGAGLEGEGAASLSGSDLVFTTKTGANDLAAQEQTHNTLMVMEAGMAVLAAGNEHVEQAMAGLANTQNAAVDGTVTAASMGGSKSRYKTGSHVDSNSWNVAVAVGSKRELTKGSLEWGVFGEYGKSNYTLHSDAGRGDGDSHYAGGGLMAKWTNKHDVYTEASVRLGRLSDTASNLLRDAAGNGYGYDVHANYFGAHVGIGKIIHYKGGKSLDVYGKYFYTKRDGVDFASGGNNYSLDSVASSVLRVGARYGTTDKKWNWYGGLAYEYEFDGKSEGTVDGVGIRAASVKGGSVRGEIGLRMSATKTNPWQTDISIYGYGGKHRGFGGSVNVAYMF